MNLWLTNLTTFEKISKLEIGGNPMSNKERKSILCSLILWIKERVENKNEGAGACFESSYFLVLFFNKKKNYAKFNHHHSEFNVNFKSRTKRFQFIVSNLVFKNYGFKILGS